MGHYDVVWDSPSDNSSGSMPLGNGDIGVNVWSETGGDLLLLISKTDAWDENGRLLKIGRVRVHFAPDPFGAGLPFQQTLRPEAGEIVLSAGAEESAAKVRVWVDALHPVIHIEAEFAQAVETAVSVELWRTEAQTLPFPVGGVPSFGEHHCPIGLLSPEDKAIVSPDIVLDAGQNSLAWCHHNTASVWAATMRHQGLESLMAERTDPLLFRTFGAVVEGDGLVKDGALTLRSAQPSRTCEVAIYPLTDQAERVEEWQSQAESLAAECRAVPRDTAYAAHTAWWQVFWERSRIIVEGDVEAEAVTRGYALHRFMVACAGRGEFPIKFNGALFTVDACEDDGTRYNADYRRWGGGYWFQNTRLIYWAMIAAGDFDLMQPWFQMYAETLSLAEERTRLYYGHGGVYFPEVMTFWGTYLNGDYGYSRAGKAVGDIENEYIRHYWQGTLELSAILLDVYAATEDNAFLSQTLLPLVRPFLRFYFEHYLRRDDDGKILFTPAQALETWHTAVNPLPEIAGIGWVIDRLLELPGAMVPASDREEWAGFRALLPAVPKRHEIWSGKTELIPALQYDILANWENVGLYAVFPYRLFGVGKPEIETGRTTYDRRPNQATRGWRQDAIHAALLGLTADAKRCVAENFSAPHAGSRFSAFWGPNYDWIPDMDHGSVASIALQRMLMQCDGGQILLLPAWPLEWDVEFKLCAPQNTIVEGIVRQGRVQSLTVTPPHRAADIHICEPFQQ